MGLPGIGSSPLVPPWPNSTSFRLLLSGGTDPVLLISSGSLRSNRQLSDSRSKRIQQKIIHGIAILEAIHSINVNRIKLMTENS